MNHHMTCRRITELLIDFVDGNLPEEEHALLQRHLCGCVPCAIYLHTYQDTIQLTKSLPEEPLPMEFACRLKAMITEACQKKAAESEEGLVN